MRPNLPQISRWGSQAVPDPEYREEPGDGRMSQEGPFGAMVNNVMSG